MRARPFRLVDVFAEEKYQGNPLAVVLDGEGLSDAEMQTLAREINYSETTFLLDGATEPGARRVRIFTPREEVPFAGHPTLGTAWVVQQVEHRDPAEDVRLEMAVGTIPVSFEEEDGAPVLWMTQRPPEFGPTLPAEAVAPVLGLETTEIDPRHPVQVVSTGLPFWIVPLTGLEAVRRCRVDAAAYAAFVGQPESPSLFVFCGEACDPAHDLHARMFSDHHGVPEDPATGSANGCLAAWLVRHRYLGAGEVAVRVEQGWEMGRPSLLRLRARSSGDGSIEVRVGGRVFPTAQGEWL